MNRRLLILIGLALLLVLGGALTSFVASQGVGSLIPVLNVTRIPEGSVNQFAGNQGFWFVLMVGFIIFNLVGASLTFTLIGWWLSREVERAKADEPANHKTIAEAFRFGNRQRNTANELPASSGK